jgi:hypothetical protein
MRADDRAEINELPRSAPNRLIASCTVRIDPSALML